jgi:3-methyladenine DNA glycosylase/8-oxoguanine DNA glycosylase
VSTIESHCELPTGVHPRDDPLSRGGGFAAFLSKVSDHMERKTTHITMPKPFSLKATALGHGWHECAPMSWCEAGGCLQTVERIGDMPVRVSLTEADRRGKDVRVRVLVEADTADAKTVSLVRERVARMLSRGVDLTGFYTLIEDHPQLAVLPRIGAGRILRSPCMVENIIKTICGTNVNWTQAVKMINRIGQLGPHLPEFRSLNAWPSPKEILAAGEGYLKDVARVGYRAESILSLCRQVVDGELRPDEFDDLARAASTDELRARLLSIRGVGPASANFLLSLLGRFDRISIDSWTVAYVGNTYLNGKKATAKQVERIYAKYGQWQHLVWWFEQWLTWGTARSMLT